MAPAVVVDEGDADELVEPEIGGKAPPLTSVAVVVEPEPRARSVPDEPLQAMRTSGKRTIVQPTTADRPTFPVRCRSIHAA